MAVEPRSSKQNPETFRASQKSPANLVMGLLFMAILPLTHSGAGQADKPKGRISGHVYRADTHTPLAEVTMILQVANAAPVQTVQTAVDGGYSFDNLDANDYTLAAWKTGFVGRVFGAGMPNNGLVIQDLKIVPPLSLEGIDLSLQPEPQIAQMADTALWEAHANLRSSLGFENGWFSPDGSEFAFGLTNIRSGDTDEIWLYSLRDRRLRRVADRPGPYVWGADGKLYAWFWSNRKIYVVATPDSISEIDQPPSAIVAAFARWKPWGHPDTTRAGEYLVSTDPQGHGSFRLLVSSAAMPRAHVIAEGSWELETYLLDPARLLVLYPKDGSFGSIVNYNLRSGQSAELHLQSGENLRLLDVTGDGKLLAYSVSGPCSQDAWNYLWLLFIEGRLEHPATNVCFVRLQ